MARGNAARSLQSPPDFIDHALKHPVPSYDEQKPTLVLASQGDTASVEQVFRMNLKYLLGQARKYAKMYGLPRSTGTTRRRKR